MIIIIHRINTIAGLKKIPFNYGVEIDVRAFGNKLILNHEPFESGDELEEYLEHFKHAFIIFNIKEAGIEKRVIELAQKCNIENYFLLDVEPYWIHHAALKSFKKMALRYSENEPIESALQYRKKADWIWIDIPTKLPLNKDVIDKMSDFRTCLVCPERWGRPEQISEYVAIMKGLSFQPDAVMTSLACADQWSSFTSSKA